MRRYSPFAVSFLALLFSLIALPADAEVAPGRLTGQVVDQSGAVVARASITVRRPAIGFERRLEPDSEGSFSVPELAPGDYEVTATSAGFALAVQRVSIGSGEIRQVPFRLRVGGLTEDVVVVAAEIAGSHERLRRFPGSVDVVERE